MSRRRSKAPVSAWWSEPGPSACDFCFGRFHVEVGYYCAGCDRPICPGCVLWIRERHVAVCPECHLDRADGASGDPG